MSEPTWTLAGSGIVCHVCGHSGYLLEGGPEWLAETISNQCSRRPKECSFLAPGRVIAEPDEEFRTAWLKHNGKEYEPYVDHPKEESPAKA